MGGDFGPSVVVPAAIKVLEKITDINLILVGDSLAIKNQLKLAHSAQQNKISIVHTTEVVTMDELPSVALRRKKDSSMRVSVNLVKEGRAHACVSAGNTGALMATAHFVLKPLPGVDRSAIISSLPTRDEEHPVRILDLGANVDCTADELYQFAIMGSVLCSAVDNIENPKVGLLNIGEEQIKGNTVVKETAMKLQETKQINYIGFIEADHLYSGLADVVVCDGFVGNVTLKTVEGIAKLISFYIKKAFSESWLTKLAALIAMPVLNRLRKKMDPSRYNGASFIGVKGTVIKSHGGANVMAFTAAIIEAVTQAREQVPTKIQEQITHILQEG